jgi:hypothetical protein
MNSPNSNIDTKKNPDQQNIAKTDPSKQDVSTREGVSSSVDPSKSAPAADSAGTKGESKSAMDVAGQSRR